METLIFPQIFGRHVTAFFTGKSPGADPEKISVAASIDKQKIYLPIQKHTDKVLVLNSDLSPKVADAVITNNKGILIGVQVADCVPVLLHDAKKNVIGVVHAGWRGTAASILKKTIEAMQERFSSFPIDIKIAIGPSIRWCCYHVGYDVLKSVEKATGIGEYHNPPLPPFSKGGMGGFYCLDLALANKYQAVSAGISEKNIWMSDECTYCYPDKFYSYRYAKGHTGRQGGFIGLLF
ncbi:MAG: laccase [Nitrospirae bacterium CG22_combo_CG10-13_8_21_14_all_44_11]|nr:MAG: laccase [Nitrospirae bacterium CG22_combo_CG10-13_8_21_14_all_44_11]